MNKLGVLVLDDHPIVLEGISSVLNEEHGFELLAISRILRGVSSMVKKLKPDIIIADIFMESPTFQFIHRIKKANPHIKILFMTGYDSLDNVKLARQYGASGLVSKLEGLNGLRKALKKISNGGKYFSYPPTMPNLKFQSSQLNCSEKYNHPLSPRELDILSCVSLAMTAREIAKDLHISVKTVERHKANIMEKLNMKSQIEIVRYAIRIGLIEA